MRLPPPLAAGARVALIAPAGPVRSPDAINDAAAQTRSFGWEPVIGEHAAARVGYFAGSDADRLHDLNSALQDDTIDGIWCLRGGYGVMRLLHDIDVDAMRTRPRTLIGYSDITALHAALGNAADIITFHGPHAALTLTSFARDSFERAVVAQRDPCGNAPGARTVRAGRAEGRLVGGNLSLLASLCGTRFAPNYADSILVLEDIGEPTYRIDRMLRQLALSGVFDRVAGIAYGQFTEGTDPGDANSRDLDDVLREAAHFAGVPALAGIPLGHIDDQWTIPLGAMAELDADGCTLHVALA
jgi:muramoyltetrapeptide carboxypeptidase